LNAPSRAEGERPAGVRRSARFSPELEAMRGVAALLVVVYHAHSLLRPKEPEVPTGLLAPLRAFVEEGHTGVTLFFVLSAFLLSRPFLEGARRGTAPSARRFWVRRALRILPLYFLAVAVATVLSAKTPADLLHGLPYLFFLNSQAEWVTSLFPYSTAWWSLATEAQFYLVLPLAGWLAVSRRGRWALAAALALGGAAYLALVTQRLRVSSVGGQLSLTLSILGRAPAFVFGIGSAWLSGRYGERIRAATGRSRWFGAGGADALLAALVLGLGLLLLHLTPIGFFVAEAYWVEWHAYEALLWSAILLVVLLAPLRCRVIFTGRLLGWIGIVSYSIYLWHYPILYSLLIRFWTLDGGPGWTARASLAALLGFALTGAASVLTYRFVERPFLVRKARIEG
jgi:peptidoglycan/LPS O-acetylase OafA/YrhL